MVEPQDQRLSVEAICKCGDVSSDTAYRWIGHSAVPAQQLGRKWEFEHAQVNACVGAGGTVANEAREGDTEDRVG